VCEIKSAPWSGLGTPDYLRINFERRAAKVLARKAERDAVNSIPKSRLRWDASQCRFYAESAL
jgi:hypothetical protein